MGVQATGEASGRNGTPATSSLEALRAEVLGCATCTACGACVGLCPYIIAVDDNVASAGSCRIDGGRCYRFCPRTEDETAVGLGGDAGFTGNLGRVRAAYLARAAGPGVDRGAAGGAPDGATSIQHGGSVSTLLRQALRDGLVRTAVLTEDAGAGSPRTARAGTEAEVDACRGSKFAVTPVVAEVNRALAAGRDGLGVVALPCQATALVKMRTAGSGVPTLPGGVTPAAGISLVVGLFCTWALEQEGWRRLVRQRLGTGPFRRVDIPPPPAEVLVAERPDGSRSEAPLAEVRALVRPGCRVCMDMTAENADLSVGMAETAPGWNTLLVRTPAGEDLVLRAVAAGALELRSVSVEGMAHLEAASLGKKRRASEEARTRLSAGDDPGAAESPYLARVASWEGVA